MRLPCVKLLDNTIGEIVVVKVFHSVPSISNKVSLVRFVSFDGTNNVAIDRIQLLVVCQDHFETHIPMNLTNTSADLVRYCFIVSDSRQLLLADFSAHSKTS